MGHVIGAESIDLKQLVSNLAISERNVNTVFVHLNLPAECLSLEKNRGFTMHSYLDA